MNNTESIDMAGLIWACINGKCGLHFDITIVGKDKKDQKSCPLKEFSGLNA
jgi:hypothetical protein